VDGANARTPTPEARHEPGESEIAEAHCPASPTPSPQKRAYLLGYASGSRDCWAGGPQRIVLPNPPPEEGLMLTRGYYGPCLDVVGFGCPRWLAGLSTPPIHPSPPGMASGGYGRPGIGEARRQPPAAIGSSSLGHWPATGFRIPPAMEDPR
jgi:hypothetical protein